MSAGIAGNDLRKMGGLARDCETPFPSQTFCWIHHEEDALVALAGRHVIGRVSPRSSSASNQSTAMLTRILLKAPTRYCIVSPQYQHT
jgi:hypothetical protein